MGHYRLQQLNCSAADITADPTLTYRPTNTRSVTVPRYTRPVPVQTWTDVAYCTYMKVAGTAAKTSDTTRPKLKEIKIAY